MSDNTFGERIAALETRMRSEVATQYWVEQILNPIRTDLQSLSASIKSLAEDTKHLYAAHDQLLKERAQREKEEHEEKMAALRDRTLLPLIKNNWMPLGGFFVVCISLASAFGGFINWYLNHVLK